MTAQPLEQVSRSLGGFYVPRFEVRIEGAGLPDDVLRDVIEVRYRDSIDELDSFQITVNNWDAGRREFKYIGSETGEALSRGDDRSQLYRLFEPCNKVVQLSMGYAPDMKLMITGSFVTMEPQFAESAAPTLNVRGLNVLHKFRRKKYDDTYRNRRDSEIASDIVGRRDRQSPDSPKRFPIGIRTEKEVLRREHPIPFVAQKSEYDIDFLWKRARYRGYVLIIEEENDEHQRQLYFGPSVGMANRVSYQLEWGKSLIQFNPRLTTANQFKSVTVKSWDRARQCPIGVTVDLRDKRLNRLNSDLYELVFSCDPREECVVVEPKFSEGQARERARALLLDQLKQMCQANGSTVGLPELRAGSYVEIVGIGSRLSGNYFVTETEHVINDSGYLTRFKARREQQGGPENLNGDGG